MNARLRADLRTVLLASGAPFAIDPQIELVLQDIVVRGREVFENARINESVVAAVRNSTLSQIHAEFAPPGTGTWETPQETPVDRAIDSGISFLMEDQSQSRTLVVLDLGFEGITHWVWKSGENGISNATSDAPRVTPWSLIVPYLKINGPALWRYQLAGGRNCSPIHWSQMRESLSALFIDFLGGDRQSRVVVVNRLVGWEVASIAMEALQNHGGLHAQMVNADPQMESLHSLVIRSLRRVPMSEEYCLVTAHISQAGTVDLVHQVLAFAQEETSTVARANVFMPPFAAPTLLLPILTRKARSSEAWRPVAVGSIVAGTAMGHATTVKILRDAPGKIRFESPPSIATATSSDWEHARQNLPRRLRLELLRPLDVVCAIEMSGRAEVVQPRLVLIRAVLSALNDAEPGGDRIKATVIGYYDHSLEALNQREHSDPLVIYGPASVAGAIAGIQGWTPPNTQVGQFVTSVEDMLHAVAHRPWRALSSRVLLTVGSRPPYPSIQQRESTSVCPFGRDWRRELQTLVREWRRMGVVDPPAWITNTAVESTLIERYEDMWSTLSIDGRFELNETSVQGIVDQILGGMQESPKMVFASTQQVRLSFEEKSI